MAGFRDVGRVEFGVADVVKDLYGLGAEASCALLLDFVVGAGFWCPVHEELADRSDWSAVSSSSCTGHVERAESVGGDCCDGRELAG